MRLHDSISRLQGFHAFFRHATFVTANWAIVCPELDAKVLLAQHVWQHATAVARLDARLAELGRPGSDTAHARTLFAPAALARSTGTRIAALYAHAAPAVLRDLRAYLAAADTVYDAPSIAIVRDLERAMSEQIDECTRAWAALRAAFPDAFADEPSQLAAQLARDVVVAGIATDVDLTVPEQPGLDPRLTLGTVPARDIGPDKPRALMHVMLTDTEIATIELSSRLILETPGAPWDFVVDMARQTWDEARHAMAVRRRLEELGGRVGEFPLSRYLWNMMVGQPPAVRLAIQQRIGEWSGVEGAIWHGRRFAEIGDERTTELWEYVAEDEIGHVAFGNRWIAHFAGSESAIQAVHDQALAVRRAHGKNLDPVRPFPFVRAAAERAGFAPRTVDEYEAHARTHGTRFA